MSSSSNENEEPSSSGVPVNNGEESSGGENTSSQGARPPAKRRISSTVIEISDTESDDSDVCAVNSYQATADEVKRIRGADYSSSSSSSSDYSSDSESPWEDDSIVLEDERPQQKAIKAQLNPRANRMENPKLNPRIKSEELIDRLRTHWEELKDYKSEEIMFTCEPFRVCLLHDFLENADIINNIVDDMNTLDWSRKKMDLYEFHQTADLANLTWQRSIRGIYELLKTEVMTWVSQVTGLELTSVSASCSLYGPGDHLLPHDDLLGDRRVAFILYLAPWRPPPPLVTSEPVANGAGDHACTVQVDSGVEYGWGEHMGGALELIARDERGRPGDVVRSIYPRNNMLAFFKVGTESYHQVGEVVSLELPRLSINGWFYGPAPPRDMPPEPEPPPERPPQHRPHAEVVVLNQWVHATYMSPRSRTQVQTQMERESEVCLRDLLLAEPLGELVAALRDPAVPWEKCGPSNQRRYTRVPETWIEGLDKCHPVRGLVQLFTSTVFFRLLADCTDLTLTTYERLELQRWSPGDFTLLPPRELYQHARLEAILYLGVPQRPLCGGSTSFVAPEEGAGAQEAASLQESDALVTLPPIDNSLNLVYCDAGAASFTKYLSKLTMKPDDHFFVLTCTYRE